MNATELAAQVGMLSADEVALIHRCAKLLPPNPVVVNIGANVGTSAMAILEARPDAFIFSLDKRPCPDEAANLARAGLDVRRVVRVLGDSGRIGKNWPYQADMVLVDGSHTNEGVQADIDAWKPRCKYIMLFHDVRHPNLPELTPIVERAMMDWQRLGEARYLVAFQKI